VEERTRKAQFVVWLQSAYAEVFVRWMHIKAIRAFAESVLRYGLPPDFMAAVVVPKPGQQKRLRAELAKLYGHLSGARLLASDEEETAVAAAAAGQEFYPYVYLLVNLRK
jgi:V-type H+-transporting ATPase subunit C